MANKDKSMELQPSGSNSLSTPENSQGVFGRGFEGYDSTDIVMPTVRLVQATSSEVDLADGSEAEIGTYYHKGEKKAYKQLKVVVFFSKKTTEHDEESNSYYPQARVLCAFPDKIDKPFVMFFSKSNYWACWKPFINTMKEQGAVDPWDKIVIMESVKVKNEKGSWFQPVFKLGPDTTTEQRKYALAIYEKFSSRFSNSETVNQTDPITGDEDVKVEEVPF